jgi:pimeloyl-ACP methyl ester carboxylesterase
MIHALPGMGADRRMYPEPWSDISDFIAHDWVPYSGELSLREIALAMCDACRIEDGDDLIGTSLGGMVACEITKIRKIRRLYLLSSAVRKEEICKLLAILHPLTRIAPIDWLRVSAGKIPLEVTKMFAGSESLFIRAMCSAIFQWEGLGPSETKVLRLHGRRDLVIPPPKEVDLLLEGGHLISMTHPMECTVFIKADRQRLVS